jgi:hypothetical protein
MGWLDWSDRGCVWVFGESGDAPENEGWVPVCSPGQVAMCACVGTTGMQMCTQQGTYGPCSYPVSIYAQGISVTEHVLTKDGTSTPLEHVWLDASTASSGLRPYFRSTSILYGAPFEANAKYRVRIVGTHAGGALTKEWTFTVAAR